MHAAGGRIFLQIRHGRRACHPLLNHGAQPVAPSALAITSEVVPTPQGKQPCAVPRALRDDELPGSVAGLRNAAVNARRPASTAWRCAAPRAACWTNSCTMVPTSAAAAMIAPLHSFNSMLDSDPLGLTAWLAERLNAYELACLHVRRGDFKRQQAATW